MNIHISDHAILRFLERVKGVDVTGAIAEMRSPALTTAIEIGAPIVVHGSGARLVIKGGCVVTVLAKGMKGDVHFA